VSAKTYNALQEAITAHVADELETDVVLVKDWVLVASTSDLESIEGCEEIVVHRSPNTPLYSVTGLLHWGATTMIPDELD
jgi:glycerophosphoryl diester phosphodiesterase